MTVRELNLSSLESVRSFASGFGDRQCDLLVNNAGVMMIPELRLTEDGHEEQWGVNYLAHFHLTSLLFDNLLKSGSARIVNVSSAANSFGKVDDLNALKYTKDGYDPWQA